MRMLRGVCCKGMKRADEKGFQEEAHQRGGSERG